MGLAAASRPVSMRLSSISPSGHLPCCSKARRKRVYRAASGRSPDRTKSAKMLSASDGWERVGEREGREREWRKRFG